ncbi:hypothetical protein WSM22_36310 [Cytophagales bacterium WSM2-2]|nr:hypothetical protein WSM22_36310 [Cytophagales bacterium WSM2-2]
MKNSILIVSLILFYLDTSGQDAKVFLFYLDTLKQEDPRQILQRSYNKCQSIQGGYYEMDVLVKVLSKKDTINSSFNCYFNKSKGDTLFRSVFHNVLHEKNKYAGEVMYTGKELIIATAKDSTATVMSKSLWARDIKAYAIFHEFHFPFVYFNSDFKHNSDLSESISSYEYIGEESLNSELCHHIQVNKNSKKVAGLRVEYHYWIKKEDAIPIQYSFTSRVAISETASITTQYEKVVVKKYETDNSIEPKFFSRKAIPSFYDKVKDYTPVTR